MRSTSMPGNMKHHSGIWLALLVWSIHQETGAFDLSGPKTYQVLIGSDVVLRCSFNVDQLPVDSKFLAIHWFFMGKPVLTYDNVLNVSRPGLSMDLQAALMGDASLRISKVTISDKGVYKCLVVYSPHSKMKEITLDVQGRPSVKVVAKPVRRDEENMLHCSITGFYPLGITITWLRGDEAIDTYVTYKPQRQKDGTYSVNSTVVIIPTTDNWNETITCKVTHPSVQYPLLETYRLTLRGSLDWSCVSVLSLLIGVPIVVFLGAALVTCWIWRRPVCRREPRADDDDDDDDDDDEAPRPPQNRHSRCSQMFCRSTEEERSASTEKNSFKMLKVKGPSPPVSPVSSRPVPPVSVSSRPVSPVSSRPVPPVSVSSRPVSPVSSRPVPSLLRCSRPSSRDPGSLSPALEDPLTPLLRDVVEQSLQQSSFFSRSPGSARSLKVTCSWINPDDPDNTGLMSAENRRRSRSAGNLQENGNLPTGYQAPRSVGGCGTGHVQTPKIIITQAEEEPHQNLKNDFPHDPCADL